MMFFDLKNVGKESIFCEICRNSISSKEKLTFSCNHSVCFQCFPYILYNSISKNGLKHEFFTNFAQVFHCLKCKDKGNCHVDLKEILGFLEGKDRFRSVFEENKENLCESCEKQESVFCCVDCNNQNYCETCLNLFHQQNKRFQNHKIISFSERQSIIDSSKSLIKMSCKCPAQRVMSNFCLECQNSICQYCSIADHNYHEKKPLTDVFKNINDIKSDTNEKSINEIKTCIFENFKNSFFEELEKKSQNKLSEINQSIGEIIDVLNKIREEYTRKIYAEIEGIRNNFILLQKSMNLIFDECDNVSNLHPNKIFHLSSFFSDSEFKFLKISTSEFKLEEYSELSNIFEIINSFRDSKNNVSILKFEGEKFIEIEKIDLQNSFNNFVSPFEKMFQKEPMIIDETFFSRWNKPQISGSFILNSETFVFWPGIQQEDDKITSILNIYNLSTKSKEISIKTGEAPLTFIAVFPKYSRYDMKKYLLCADDFGLVFIYDITNNKFPEILQFNTKATGILSAIIFDDLNYHLEKFEKIDKELHEYIILSFDNPFMQINIYRIHWKNTEKVILLKVIQNPLEKVCSIIDFYNKEEHLLNKSFLVFGFQTSIRLYDLKEDHWGKDFKIKGHPTSLIIFDQKEIVNGGEIVKKYLIFSQANNYITLVDLDSEMVLFYVKFRSYLIYSLYVQFNFFTS